MKKTEGLDRRSENVNIRTSPSTKFAIEFAARVKGWTTTQLVEHTALEFADDLTVAGLTWRDFDDPMPGISWLKMYMHKIALDRDEDETKRFVLAHVEFFYDGKEPNRRRTEVLWPQVAHYADLYRRTARTNANACGEAMNKALTEARVKAVKWPSE